MDYSVSLLTDYSVKFGSILLLLSLGIYWYISYVYSYWTRKGVPGPPAVPFLGNYFVISKPVPLVLIDYCRKYGKFFGYCLSESIVLFFVLIINVFSIYQGQTPALCIVDPKIIKRILMKDFHIFRNRSGYDRKDILSKSMMVHTDEKWKRGRSLVSQTFTAAKLRKMQPLIMQCLDSMMKHLEQLADTGQSFLLQDVTGKYSIDVIARCVFATDINAYGEGDNPFIMNANTRFNYGKLSFILMQSVPKILQRKFGSWIFASENTEKLEGLGFHLVRQRKTLDNESKPDDLLQMLIDAEQGSHDDDWKEDVEDLPDNVNSTREEFEQEKKYLSNFVGQKFLGEEEIVANIIMFLLAGYGTTSATLKFILYELAVNPDAQQKLYEEIKTVVDQGKPLDHDTLSQLPYLDAVISESLRLHPQSLVLSRLAAEEYHIPEYNHTMEKGEHVLIPVYAIHHDPEYYENPDQFNPERFMPENRCSIVPGSYLPFGAGPRNCVGTRLALLILKIALANIVNKFILYKTEQTSERLKIAFCLFLLAYNPIYVGVKRRT